VIEDEEMCCADRIVISWYRSLPRYFKWDDNHRSKLRLPRVWSL